MTDIIKIIKILRFIASFCVEVEVVPELGFGVAESFKKTNKLIN